MNITVELTEDTANLVGEYLRRQFFGQDNPFEFNLNFSRTKKTWDKTSTDEDSELVEHNAIIDTNGESVHAYWFWRDDWYLSFGMEDGSTLVNTCAWDYFHNLP